MGDLRAALIRIADQVSGRMVRVDIAMGCRRLRSCEKGSRPSRLRKELGSCEPEGPQDPARRGSQPASAFRSSATGQAFPSASSGRNPDRRVGRRRRRRIVRAQLGIHQLASPSRRMSAGTSRARMTVASKMIPAASPIASSLISKPGPWRGRGTRTSGSSAALVTSLPVRARPSSIAFVRGAGLVVGLAHAREHEDLVVHREAEEEGEDHQRDPGVDRLRRVDAPDRRAVALLEDDDDDPERRRERERGSGARP